MRTDELIQREVETQLRWHSGIDATDIVVHVKDGVVTLTGYARNYYEKSQAEEMAKRVVDVTGVAADIKVRLPASSGLTDPEIARAAAAALKSMLPRISSRVQIIVQERHVVLEGRVQHPYERVQAESVVRRVPGIRAFTNNIRVVKNLAASAIKEQIEHAFRTRADLDASHVLVETQGSQVKLKGEVASVPERAAALVAARAIPGVTVVLDELVIRQ